MGVVFDFFRYFFPSAVFVMFLLIELACQALSLVKPVVYGNVAKYFGKKREEDGHTHQWTVYVRPFHNEDMSCYVKKVNFKLHDSYANQNRVLTKPPYEVTETGWGEFEIVIKIYFQDSNERPVNETTIKKKSILRQIK